VLNWKLLFLAIGLSFALALPAGAQSETIVVETPWARATPPGARTAAGYLAIRNTGAEPDRLVAAASPRAERVELHEMTIADGVARMRPLPDGVAVAPGDAVVLEPGGMHLMFRSLDEAFAAGQTVPVTLSFEKAGEKRVALPVVPIGAGPPGGHRGAGHGASHEAGHDARR